MSCLQALVWFHCFWLLVVISEEKGIWFRTSTPKQVPKIFLEQGQKINSTNKEKKELRHTQPWYGNPDVRTGTPFRNTNKIAGKVAMLQSSHSPSKVRELETMQQSKEKHALQINLCDNHALSKIRFKLHHWLHIYTWCPWWICQCLFSNFLHQGLNFFETN